MVEKSIVTRSAHFVSAFFTRHHRSWGRYHNIRHTRAVVSAARRIGKAVELNAEDVEIVVIAAWFHDTGYAITANGHEKESAAIAARFLTEAGYPSARMRKVLRCIMVTQVPQRPRILLQKVMCDADMSSLGQKTFLVSNEFMRQEVQKRKNRCIDADEWLYRTDRFLRDHRFHTGYGKTVLEQGRRRNLLAVQSLLRNMNNGMRKRRKREVIPFAARG